MKPLLPIAPVLLAACAPPVAQPAASIPPEPRAPARAADGTFVCQAFDRPSVYDKVKAIGEVRVSEPGDRSISSPRFRFRVFYWNDRYDGRSFLTYVYSQPTGKLIEESLFQLDREKGPANQFSRGGHGFTGLRYVHSPDSLAELQYWCTYG